MSCGHKTLLTRKGNRESSPQTIQAFDVIDCIVLSAVLQIKLQI